MTEHCIKTLKELRKDILFEDLTLEQLLYECLRANGWDREELIIIIDSLIKEHSEKAEWLKYENS